ncbi:MAG: M36 family metallopeptidase, partial [Thermoanaerobaculia bacterium]
YVNRDDVVGEYSTNDPNGVRSAPYTNYGRTYGDFGGNSIHFDGEIYAATMWKLLELWEAAGNTQDELFDYVIGGMNFTPSGPAFEDMRDGILAASPTQEKDCIIWDAFAQFGVGVGAEARVRGGGPFGGSVTVIESFEVPVECTDCTVTENPEVSCSDGQDNDCDGLTDGSDPDCSGGCAPIGASCSEDLDCCSGNCSNGKPSTRVCQ